MDDARFDEMARGLDARLTRRHAGGLVTGALLALGLAMDADAKKKKKKKKTFCLNGQTTVVKGPKKKLKKKVKKLRKQGATSGACSQPPPPTCTWTNQSTFGSFGSGPNNFMDTTGVAITTDGLTALIADNENNRISVWTRPNSSSPWSNQTTFGSLGTGDDNFDYPESVAITLDGLTALVADSDNNRISVWTRPTASSTDWSNQTTFGSFGTGPSNFSFPFGVTVTSDGLTALIADDENHRISVWTRPTASSTDWSNQTTFGSEGTGDDNFTNPNGLAVTPDGLTALVADTENHRISVWTRPNASSTDWSNQTTFGSEGSGPSNFDFPYGVAVTADGLTALVADNLNSRVSVWTRPNASSPTWSNQATFGSEGTGPSNFTNPWGVAVTPDGQTSLVIDSGNDRISVWTLTDCS